MKELQASVCIDAVFEGKSYEEACRKVKESGIGAIEFWGWWNRDLESLVKAQQKYDLNISACCTKFISLVDQQCRDAYLRGLEESIIMARQLNTQILISQVGKAIPNVSREKQTESLIQGLKDASQLLKNSGITLVIEPLNELVDHPDYFLIKSKEAFDVVDAVDSPSIKVIFDIYHQQISEGHVIKNCTQNIAKIAHFHAAGNPGRHELQRGEINYPEVFAAINATGFEGYVGLEYWPLATDTVTSLREVQKWLHEYEETM
jgi:hydroxypyruvate isomerase